jgi:hypothetical protein
MSIGSLGRDTMSEEEYREIQEQMQREQEDRNTAQQLASSAAMDQQPDKEGYWEVIGKPDIGRTIDDQHLEDYLATELSSAFALGNISYQDWQSWQWQTENEFWTLRNEFKDGDSNLEDDDMRMMYGEDKPELTDERERRLRSAMQVKKLKTSLSIDAEGLRRGTEIHAVAKTEDSGEDDDGGRFSGIKGWLGQ